MQASTSAAGAGPGGALAPPVSHEPGKSQDAQRHSGGFHPRSEKKAHDRHDATGRGHETEKKHGAGRGNWGENTADEFLGLADEVAQDLEKEQEKDEGQPERVSLEDAPDTGNVLTLEEYELQQAKQE